MGFELSDWMGEDSVRFFFRFSRPRLLEAGFDLEAIKAGAALRSVEEGAFDGHPWIDMAPSLSVMDARRAAGKIASKREMRFRGEDESVIDVDLDPDDHLRRLAVAIKAVGGDWRVYHVQLTTPQVKDLQGWAGLSQEKRVEALRSLAEEDVEKMRRRLSRSMPDEAARKK